MLNNFPSISCLSLPESGTLSVARKREKEERAVVVIPEVNENNNKAKPLRNREGDDRERTFIRTKNTHFEVSCRVKSNEVKAVLTVYFDNQPLTSISRRERIREPLEKFMLIAAESMENDPATRFVNRSLFENIVSSMQLFGR